jgi:hypothetical protein
VVISEHIGLEALRKEGASSLEMRGLLPVVGGAARAGARWERRWRDPIYARGPCMGGGQG